MRIGSGFSSAPVRPLSPSSPIAAQEVLVDLATRRDLLDAHELGEPRVDDAPPSDARAANAHPRMDLLRTLEQRVLGDLPDLPFDARAQVT